MKQLLSGVALAAVLAIATPVLAQNGGGGMAPGGTTSSSMSGSGNSTAAAGSYSGTSAAPVRHRRSRHVTSHRAPRHYASRSKMAPGDTQTQDLNRQELARLQGGSAPSASPAPMMEPDRNSPGPRASGGGAHIRTQ